MRLNFVQRGPQRGHAVVMLHGYSDSSHSFSRVLPLMPADLRVIALDQRGHGASDCPDEYSMELFADDVVRVMDEAGIASATLVGHSMGSFVARLVAERAPHRVDRLVLIGTAPSVRTDTVAELRGAVDALTDPVDEAFIRDFQRSTIFRPVPEEFFERVVVESKRLPARVWKQVMHAMWDYAPAAAISRPTLVLGGTQDTVFSVAEQAAVCHAATNGTLHIEPFVGHSLHWEAPDRFVALAFPGVVSKS